MGLHDSHRSCANNYNVLVGGEFQRNVHLDKLIFLDVLHLRACEGGVDVVGVVTPLVRGGAQVLHGDQSCRAQCAARSA